MTDPSGGYDPERYRVELPEITTNITPHQRAVFEMGYAVGQMAKMHLGQHIKVSAGYEERLDQDIHLPSPFEGGKGAPLERIEVDYSITNDDFISRLYPRDSEQVEGLTEHRFFPKTKGNITVGDHEIEIPVGLEVACFKIPKGMTWSDVCSAVEASDYELPDIYTGFAYALQTDRIPKLNYDRKIALSDQSQPWGYERSAQVLACGNGLDLTPVDKGQKRFKYVLLVANPGEQNYVYDDVEPSQPPNVDEALQKIDVANQLLRLWQYVRSRSAGAPLFDLIEGLSLHPDEQVAGEAISVLAGIAEASRDKGGYDVMLRACDEIATGLRSSNELVSQQAAQTIIQQWAFHPDAYRSPAEGALYFNAEAIDGRTSPIFVNAALDFIQAEAEPVWYGGCDRRRIEAGYTIFGLLMSSQDYDTASTGYEFLHQAIRGGKQLDLGDSILVRLMTNKAFIAQATGDIDDANTWNRLRDAVTGKKFTHETSDAREALKRCAKYSPHADIRTSAKADLKQYDVDMKALNATDVYIQHD